MKNPNGLVYAHFLGKPVIYIYLHLETSDYADPFEVLHRFFHSRRGLFRRGQMIPSGAHLDRDCFVAVLLAMTSTYAVIASVAKQSRRGPAREQASGLHH